MRDRDRKLLWETYVSETTHSPQNSCNKVAEEAQETGDERWDRMRKEDEERGTNIVDVYHAANKGKKIPVKEPKKKTDGPSHDYQETGARPDRGVMGEGADGSDVHYVEWLKKHSNEQSEWGPVGMANVVSHPFEETYAEYVNQAGLTDPYRAAVAHMKIAKAGDEGGEFYHEVDLHSLENWKYHGKDEDDKVEVDHDLTGEDDEGWQQRAAKAGQKFRDSGAPMFVDGDDDDDDGNDDDLVGTYKKTLEDEDESDETAG